MLLKTTVVSVMEIIQPWMTVVYALETIPTWMNVMSVLVIILPAATVPVYPMEPHTLIIVGSVIIIPITIVPLTAWEFPVVQPSLMIVVYVTGEMRIWMLVEFALGKE
jgi:hypothetical protein